MLVPFTQYIVSFLHNSLHTRGRMCQDLAELGGWRISNLLKTLIPATKLPSVAPRVAGSNPVAHPNFLNGSASLHSFPVAQ